MQGDAQYPIIVFPTRERGRRQKRAGGPSDIRFPSFQRQRQRLNQKFRILGQTVRAQLQEDPQGADPDLVLVIEIAGVIKNFVNAAERVDGLEWIGEWSIRELEADEDFHRLNVRQNAEAEEAPDRRVKTSIFLLFSNQAALRKMLQLWRLYKTDPDAPFPRNFAPWKHLFKQLYDIRVWDEQDRVTPELLLDWQERVAAGEEIVPFEAELWYHQDADSRFEAEDAVRAAVAASGGAVTSAPRIEAIDYHAIVGQLPIIAVQNILENADIRLFKSREIMFLRPVSQAFVRSELPEEEIAERDIERGRPEDVPPIIAILDGVPVENHPLLTGRLILDDPDGFADDSLVADRVHGTAMASLVLHGDLDLAEQPLSRPVYMRPILRSESPHWVAERRETVPANVSFTDIVHRSVRRIFDEGILPGRIFVINLSVGDQSRLFDRRLSACAKLLDWLAWTYRVVFVVSAGNHGSDITLDMPRNSVQRVAADQLRDSIIRGLDSESINRRLLSPAESINALTVGSLYVDGSNFDAFPNTVLAYRQALPSPYNAHGLGYRRAIKPDVLFPGGRILLQERIPNPGPTAVLQMLGNRSRTPGQRVASPPGRPALNAATSYSRGTSNACALATRAAALAFEVLKDRGQIEAANPIPDEYIAVALRTLIVHGANWGSLRDVYEAALTTRLNAATAREYLAKYFGNGVADVSRALVCNSQRITVIAYGDLSDGEADVYAFPVPNALSGERVPRRLTITLSWFTPINVRHYNYRRAHLWFGFPDRQAAPTLLVPDRRTEVNALAGMRGTVQHEVFASDEARVFVDGATMQIAVNCRADAGQLADAVPYCLAVTLEVPITVNLPIYNQVATRIRQAVRVRTR